MINQIIKIRIKQLYRTFANIGLFRIFFVLILITFITLFIFSQLQNTPNGVIVIAILVGTILFIHLLRKDKVFLYIIKGKAHRIYLVEYLIFTSPIVILSLFANRFDLVIYQIIGISIISFINFSLKAQKENTYNKILKRIPSHCFEIIAGIRQNFYFIVPLNILALMLSFWVGTAPVVLLINILFFTGFYQNCEPRNIIEINERTPHNFIITKLKSNLSVFTLMQLPVIVLFLLFNIQYYMLILFILTIGLLLVSFSIVLKYALYTPNANLRANSIILGISFLVLPILVFMIPLYYFKAKNNLTTYLYV